MKYTKMEMGDARQVGGLKLTWEDVVTEDRRELGLTA